ncbi:MAG: ABC transporter substrate-binding protein [Scytonematopsis contorta HA4267-MV1]|jgi:peptide/nickel transport system substrate-binding protein|nr:ABC transporter substrate-binding protein [Scytonematopsis contorta HA4267-MV1]
MSWLSNSGRRWGRSILYLALFCTFLLFVLVGVAPQQGITSSGSTESRVTIATTLKPRTLDPADAYEASSLNLVYNMSDRLYTYPPGSTEVAPQLATELPKISADGLTYTIPLRQGVVFHDGAPFNAEAMVFSLRRFIENKGKPAFLLGDIVESVKATGEYELTIKLKQPFAAFPSMLAFTGVCAVSPKAYKLGEGKFETDIFVGTGPYKLAKYGTDKFVFDVFDKYWGKKAENNGITLQVLSSGVNLFNAFRKKSVDIAYLSMDPDQIRSLEARVKKGDWQAIPNNGSVVNYIVLNVKQKPLDILEVRQAIAAMINRDVLSERVLYGQSEPVYSLVPTTFNVYKPVFKEKYGEANIEKAKELLKKAGFTKEKPAQVEIWYPSSSAPRSLMARVLKALAKKTMDGLLEFQINAVESTTFFKNTEQGIYPTVLSLWYPDFLDADNYIQPFLSCAKFSKEKGCDDGGSRSQGSFYYNDRMNKLIDKQRQEQNPEARKQLFVQIQEQLANDVPYVPLWQSKDYVFAQNGVQGVQVDAAQNLMYMTIKK